jgi:hypothetical protein
MMDFAKKIQELESERQELNAQLNAKGIGGQERLVIRQQIIAIDRQITALYTLQSHQQPKACWRFSATFEEAAGCLELQENVLLHAQECHAYDASVQYTTKKRGV